MDRLSGKARLFWESLGVVDVGWGSHDKECIWWKGRNAVKVEERLRVISQEKNPFVSALQGLDASIVKLYSNEFDFFG
jgi:hypothetical protein